MNRIFVAFLLVILPATALAETVGNPIVISGDVIEVQGMRVQLHGIDAPELDQTCMAKGRRYNCGHIAKTALMDLVVGAKVSCKLVQDDKSAVAVAECTVNGLDLGQNMVQTGWALADRHISEKYIETEDAAKAAKRGLWRGQFIPPWKWREK